jgi:diacylglycerol O-acyltransferase
MDWMSPLDAGFLDLEDEDRHASLATALIAVFEGPAPSYDAVLAAVADTPPLLPRVRQKTRQLPSTLAGRWGDNPLSDLRYHVRQTALPGRAATRRRALSARP